jgi:glycosyltransferase involved in cell wall biosynthesis
VVQTNEQVEMCEEAFGRTPHRILSLSEPAEPAPLDRGAFLWIGRIADYKRPLEFLEIAGQAPDLQFKMIAVPTEGADPDLISAIDEKAASLDNVELVGHMPRKDLLILVTSASAIVNTSVLEGMPNIFLEGWTRGIPALSLHFDPDGVIAEHRLGISAGGDRDCFLDGARRIRDDRGLREELAQACRAYIETSHSPSAVTAQWIQALGLDDSVEKLP